MLEKQQSILCKKIKYSVSTQIEILEKAKEDFIVRYTDQGMCAAISSVLFAKYNVLFRCRDIKYIIPSFTHKNVKEICKKNKISTFNFKSLALNYWFFGSSDEKTKARIKVFDLLISDLKDKLK